MLLKYFYDKTLAQASYLVGCAATGEALVIDPARDIHPYLKIAAEEGLTITQITETHIHADYVSGSHELAAASGGTLFLSDMGDNAWKYAYPDHLPLQKVQDGDSWMLGNIRIEARHTPGHTPEHLAFIITDTAGADRPIGVFTGDFIFAGDVGRPDLLEEAAGMVGTREVGAQQQFHSLQAMRDMPDYLQLWFGHGAGSACGKALGAIPSTTLGYEKLFNPAFQLHQENEFVTWLLEGQPEAPRYFAQMKQVNKVGAPLLKNLPPPTRGTRPELERILAHGSLVVDVRPASIYAQYHRAGTLNIPYTSSNYTTYIGWFVNYEQPLYLVVLDESQIEGITRDLRAIGVDHTPRFFTDELILQGRTTSLPQITAQELAQQHDKMMIVDVRGKTEYQTRHIQGATHIPLGYLPRFMDKLPVDRPIVTQCASGYRSQVAATWLRRAGFQNIFTLNDNEQTWAKYLPTETF